MLLISHYKVGQHFCVPEEQKQVPYNTDHWYQNLFYTSLENPLQVPSSFQIQDQQSDQTRPLNSPRQINFELPPPSPCLSWFVYLQGNRAETFQTKAMIHLTSSTLCSKCLLGRNILSSSSLSGAYKHCIWT